MRPPTKFYFAVMMLFLFVAPCLGEDVIFEDVFKDGLSKKWEPFGLDKKDYRVKNGGLEMRVQNGPAKKGTPVLKVILPFKTTDTVIVSVKVTPLDEFTADGEFAGLSLWTDGGPEFAAKKKRIQGKLVFAPGKYVFRGKQGEEGDVEKYEVKYTEATNDARALRITVDRGTAFFSVGPDAKDEYVGFFHSALQRDVKECGFCLTAAGAPEKAVHWVRFTDFKVVKP